MPVMPGSPFDKGCYETITVYHVTRAFVGELWRRHAGVGVFPVVKVCAVALDFQLDRLLN